MVEIESKEEKDLKDRAGRLHEELGNCEAYLFETKRALQGTLAILSGFLNEKSAPQTLEAVNQLRMVLNQPQDNLSQLHSAMSRLKTKIIKEDKGDAQPTSGDGGKDLALAVLFALRMGEKDFDDFLEETAANATRLYSEGKAKNSILLLIKAIDQFRRIQDQRWETASQALRDVLGEVIRTEGVVANAFEGVGQGMAAVGQRFDDQVAHSLSVLALAMDAADNLEGLKSSALNHLQNLRELIKARSDEEKMMLAENKRQVSHLRRSLAETQQKMSRAEKTSKRWSLKALTDPLTKVKNRRAMEAALVQVVNDPSNQPLCLIVFDVDKFKSINDNFGHAAGDRALLTIARQVKACLRGNDELYRYAGDEFVVLVCNTALAQATGLSERIREAAAKIKFTYKGQGEHRATVSLGLTQYKQGDTPESLFKRADSALFDAKQAGRNQFRCA